MLEWSKAMQEIKQKPLEPVYTCVGPEFVLVDEWLGELRQMLAKQTETVPELTRFSFDDGDLDEALFACQSLSLFTSTQVVVLSDLWAATGAKGSSKAKYATDALESYLDNPVSQNVLVLTVSADKLDERKKLVKKLKKYPIIDCAVPKETTGHKSVQAILKRAKISMADDALAELWRRGGAVSRCATESAKLWTYTKGRTITYDDVCQLVATPPEDNIFEWIDGVVTGNADRSYRALEDLIRTGHDTFSLFGMMVRQLRIMWYAKTLSGKGYSPQQIAGEAGAHPYAVQVAQRQAARVRSRDIESLLTVVADAEFAVKSGRRDMEFALDWVVAACLAKVQHRPTRRA